jgi:hypothetical protein
MEDTTIVKIMRIVVKNWRIFVTLMITAGIITVLILNVSFGYSTVKGWFFEWRPADVKIEKKL